MALSGSRLALLAVLMIAGLYFAVDHTLSPVNHEAIGLGTNHLVHTVFGMILLAAGGYLWRQNRGKRI